MGVLPPDEVLQVLRATRDQTGSCDVVGSGHPRSKSHTCTNDQRVQFCGHRLPAPPDSGSLPSPRR